MSALPRTSSCIAPVLARTRARSSKPCWSVPANANSNQRFLTEAAARLLPGFEVLGLSNEPSAYAAIEFAHRDRAERKSRESASLLVYDLGGGTFDASLVTLGDAEYSGHRLRRHSGFRRRRFRRTAG